MVLVQKQIGWSQGQSRIRFSVSCSGSLSAVILSALLLLLLGSFLWGLSAGDERIMMLPQRHCNYSRESRTESRGKRRRRRQRCRNDEHLLLHECLQQKCLGISLSFFLFSHQLQMVCDSDRT